MKFEDIASLFNRNINSFLNVKKLILISFFTFFSILLFLTPYFFASTPIDFVQNENFIYSLNFYLVFSFMGIFGYFLLTKVLRNTNRILLYTIAKPIGLIIFAYPIWILSSFQILKFNEPLTLQILLGLFIIIGIGLFAWQFNKNYAKTNFDFNDYSKKRFFNLFLGIFSIELLTIFLLSGYLVIRSFNPQIEGTEKFMDLMLLASAGKTDYFPFFDAWWAGKDVNYYYYGFYLFALLSNIAGVPYATAYNLALGIIFCQTVIIISAVVYAITKSYLASIFGTLLINFGGNLHYANCILNNFDENLRTNCFYPRATRIYTTSYTINEFPTYSYILGDLHPHVLSLPFLAVGIFLVYKIFKEKKFNIWLHLLFGFVIATAGIINFWDFMTLGAIYGLIFVWKLSKDILPNVFAKNNEKSNQINFGEIIYRFSIALFLAGSPFIVYLLFFLHFQSPVAGIGFAPEFADYHSVKYPDMQYPSTPGFLFGFWGGFLLLIIVMLGVYLLLAYKKFKKIIYPLILIFLSIILIAFTELFFFRDLFHIANPPYFRANTVFKFTIHVWILLGIASAVLIHLAWQASANIKNIYIGLILDAFLIIFVSLMSVPILLYSYFGYTQAYGLDNKTLVDNKIQQRNLTLNGSEFIKDRNIADYETINWINANLNDRVVILESAGPAYSYHARISSHTGHGNILNWETHQWTWRFKYAEPDVNWRSVTERKIDTGYIEIGITKDKVRLAYETDSIEQLRDIINEFNVQYIYVGDLERQTYVKINENNIRLIGEIVFESGNSRLYKVKQ
jgi:uncharacterized membrane protein